MLSAQFFTTLNADIFFYTLKALTLKLPYLRYGDDNEKLAHQLKDYLNASTSKLLTFYNGRSALHHALRLIRQNEKFNYEDKIEVLVSGYTCVSVVNAVKQAGFNPVYVDIDENTLNMSLENIKKSLTSKTKILIVQHTFGNPAQIDEIVKWAHNHNIYVIEDCAHSLGAKLGNKFVGTFGDMAIFSSGRDKVFSSVTGGYLLINNEKFFDTKNIKLLPVPRRLVVQNLMYNLLAYVSYKTYDIKFGKLIMYLAGKLHLIPQILTKKEKSCNFANFYYQLPNALAYLARTQLKIIDKMNEKREKLGKLYEELLQDVSSIKTLKSPKFAHRIYFGFPILVPENKWSELVTEARKENVYLGIYWSGLNIVPAGTDLKSCDYKLGSCPIAEKISKKIIVLPCHYNMNEKDVKKVVKIVRKVLSN